MSHYAVEEGTSHVHFDFQGFQAYNNINGFKVELFLINRYPPPSPSTLEILLDMSMTNYINVCQFNKTCWCQRNLDSTFYLMTKLYNCPQLSVKQYSPTALKGIVRCIAPKQKYLFYYLLFFLYVNLGVPWIALISTHTN